MAHDTSQQVTADPVPVTLLVGFLGSGKTTLANRILSEQHDQRIAVIVNEFGDVGIDGQLIVGVDDNVIELSNGCLCCTVQGDLADTPDSIGFHADIGSFPISCRDSFLGLHKARVLASRNVI